MLNDIAWPTRLLMAGFGLAVGLILAGPVTGTFGNAGFALLMTGLLLELVVIFGFTTLLGVSDRRFRRQVAAATAEIADGTVVPVPAVGRVVRCRTVALPWWMPGHGGGTTPATIVVLTALDDGPPRRVAAIVPVGLGLRAKDVPAVLLVHPRQRDVAVVDDRVDHARLAAVDADPRWRTVRMPSDRTVVGGYLALIAALLVGAGAGLGLGALVTLAT